MITLILSALTSAVLLIYSVIYADKAEKDHSIWRKKYYFAMSALMISVFVIIVLFQFFVIR